MAGSLPFVGDVERFANQTAAGTSGPKLTREIIISVVAVLIAGWVASKVGMR